MEKKQHYTSLICTILDIQLENGYAVSENNEGSIGLPDFNEGD